MLEGALYHKDDAESRLGDAYTPVRRPDDETAHRPTTDYDSHAAEEAMD